MGGGRRYGRQDKSRGNRDRKSGLVVGRRGRKVSCGTFGGSSVAEFRPIGRDSESTGGERHRSGEHERWGAVEAEVAALGLVSSGMSVFGLDVEGLTGNQLVSCFRQICPCNPRTGFINSI